MPISEWLESKFCIELDTKQTRRCDYIINALYRKENNPPVNRRREIKVERIIYIVYCILASCYIRLINQQSTWRPQRQHNYFNKRTTDDKHNIRRSTCLAHGWQHHIGENWHNRASTSGGEYSVTTEDGRVRPKHVLIEFKKWMCYIDGRKNKYSVLERIMMKTEIMVCSMEIQGTGRPQNAIPVTFCRETVKAIHAH
jgi:hypothetical protein